MIYKRTLILNDINNKSSSKKGILTLENTDNRLVGNLKLYNITDNLQSTAIGLNVGNEILKLPVDFNSDNSCDFKAKNLLDLGGKISCALVDTTKPNNPEIVVGGTSTYHQEWASKLEQAFCLDEEPISCEEMYSIQEDEIEAVVTKTLKEDQEFLDCTHCTKCKYREAFFVDKQLEESTDKNCESQEVEVCSIDDSQKSADIPQETTQDEEPEQIEPDLEQVQPQVLQESQFINLKVDESENLPDDANFYEQVKSQIDDLFEQYSREEILEQLLPNSKWVRVRYENSENFYVLGLIYEDDKIKYISYGLPADNPNKPPVDLREYAQWLPLDAANPEKAGYWLVYQSADSGESIQIEVI